MAATSGVLNTLRRRVQDGPFNAVLLSHAEDIRWACGFTGSNSALLIRSSGAWFATDNRYEEQSRHEVVDAEIVAPSYDLIGSLSHAEAFVDGDVIGIQGDHLTVVDAGSIRAAYPDVSFRSVTGWMTDLRAIKQPLEIECMVRAQRIAEAAFERVIRHVRPGATEREIAARLQYEMLMAGAERMAFDPIVAGGAHAALPHARPRDVALQPDQLVLMDFGCVVDGYASDMTRMVVLGSSTEEEERALAAVQRALETAVERLVAGVPAADLDNLAKESLLQDGIAYAYTHSLGHGVGLEVHEAPRVSSRNDTPLRAGEVVTIEPGAYLAGAFGIRIEDMLLVTDEGSVNLCTLPREPVRIPLEH